MNVGQASAAATSTTPNPTEDVNTMMIKYSFTTDNKLQVILPKK